VAFARTGGDSDVYVYADSHGGYTCEPCPKGWHPRDGVDAPRFRCGTAAEMIEHLLNHHRTKGERVPEGAMAALRAEAEREAGALTSGDDG